MRKGRDKLDTRWMMIGGGLLILVVVASLYLFPEWRESPAAMATLLVLVAVGVVGFVSNFRSAFKRDEAGAPLPPLDYDSPQHRRNQENVCAAVRAAWIDGALKQSLTESVRLELKIDDLPGMLRRQMILVEGRAPSRQPVTGDIADVFREGGRALLILGAPGSGKTFTLLELCRPILEGAEVDPHRPVPVILNLSTWAQDRGALADWIADEMWRQYGLSRQVTPVWLNAGHLVLLLDGLDEVASDARDACVQAINNFRETHDAGMVVCSRSADYDELSEKLALMRAVEIQPLTREKIDAYLSDDRLELAAARQAVADDDALAKLADTPLMLNIMAVAYRGLSPDQLQPLLSSVRARRAHLYDAYIERMFRRRPLKDRRYTVAQVLHWLRFLAARLTERDQTQYFIEEMQSDWLPGRWRLWFGVLAGVLFGAVLGVVTGVAFSVLTGALFSVLIGALFGVLYAVLSILNASFDDIGPTDVLESVLLHLDTALDLDFNKPTTLVSLSMKPGKMVGLLISARVSALAGAAIGVKVGELVGVLAGAAVGVRVGAVVGVVFGMVFIVVFGAPFFMLFSVLFSVLISVLFGTVIQPYLLRLLLALSGSLPLRLVPFLNDMSDHILLQRAGASYRFIHRTLQEHIAELTDERIEALAGPMH